MKMSFLNAIYKFISLKPVRGTEIDKLKVNSFFNTFYFLTLAIFGTFFLDLLHTITQTLHFLLIS